jgi:hypothetical protein
MEDEISGACSTYDETRNTYRFLVKKPEIKRTLVNLGVD